jgi:endo-1,4-beta-xylanase
VSRRFVLGGLAAAAPLSVLAGQAAQDVIETPSLSREAARGGRFFGAAVRLDTINAEQDLHDAVLRDCSHLTPEIEMQWKAIEPEPGEVSFTALDDLTGFAEAAQKGVIGHSLLWHLGAPAWANERLRDDRNWRLISRHFAAVLPRFNDQIGHWIVVNEAIDPGANPEGLRANVFLDAFGPDYIPRALEEARAHAPKTRLMINEFGLEYGFEVERDKRFLFLKLLERLRSSGAPLDGVGIQAHLDLQKGEVSQAEIASFLHEIANMGLFVVITELDVKESNYKALARDRDMFVGDEVRRYLEVALNEPAVVGVTTWGVSDRHSWLEVTQADRDRFAGAWTHGDGPGLNRGLPYDSDMRRKPMYRAIASALAGGRSSGVRSSGTS